MSEGDNRIDSYLNKEELSEHDRQMLEYSTQSESLDGAADQELGPENPKHPTILRHLRESFIKGEFIETKPEEIREMVEQVYFQYSPLTPLTEVEEKTLRATMRACAEESCNRPQLRDIVEGELVFFPPGSGAQLNSVNQEIRHGIRIDEHYLRDDGYLYRFPKFHLDTTNELILERNGYRVTDLPALAKQLSEGEDLKDWRLELIAEAWQRHDTEKKQLIESLTRHGLIPMTPQEKLAFFSKTDSWSLPQGQGIGTKVGMRIQGVDRGLDEYFGLPAEGNADRTDFKQDFPDILERIKSKTGAEKLKMLDIGGGIGKALNEAQEIEPGMETSLLVAHDEQAPYHVDNYYLCPAERMPEEFSENFDIITSNIAFRYFDYPDIAMMNVIKSLAVGGEAYIEFAYDRSHTRADELEKRIQKLKDDLAKLVNEGYIILDQYKGSTHIVKLKSLEGGIKNGTA